jgi:hypothetical protein
MLGENKFLGVGYGQGNIFLNSVMKFGGFENQETNFFVSLLLVDLKAIYFEQTVQNN